MEGSFPSPPPKMCWGLAPLFLPGGGGGGPPPPPPPPPPPLGGGGPPPRPPPPPPPAPAPPPPAGGSARAVAARSAKRMVRNASSQLDVALWPLRKRSSLTSERTFTAPSTRPSSGCRFARG